LYLPCVLILLFRFSFFKVLCSRRTDGNKKRRRMALSKVKLEDLDDPFAYLPIEILVMITKYLDEDPRDLLYLALASPTFRKKVLSFRNLNSFKTIYRMVYDSPGSFTRAAMSFVCNPTDAFQEAFESVSSWWANRWLWPADVVLLLVSDVKVAEQFSAFFKEKAIPGFKVVRGGLSKEAVSDLRKSGQVIVFVAHRTDRFLPKPKLAFALDPAGAKCVQRVLHLGPELFNVFWRFNDRIGRNYAAVRRLFHAFDLRCCCCSDSSLVAIGLLPEGSVLAEPILLNSLASNHS